MSTVWSRQDPLRIYFLFSVVMKVTGSTAQGVYYTVRHMTVNMEAGWLWYSSRQFPLLLWRVLWRQKLFLSCFLHLKFLTHGCIILEFFFFFFFFLCEQHHWSGLLRKRSHQRAIFDSWGSAEYHWHTFPGRLWTSWLHACFSALPVSPGLSLQTHSSNITVAYLHWSVSIYHPNLIWFL